MDKIVLILVSIPEAFMLICLGLALYGYNIKDKFKYILVAAVTEAILAYFSRNMIDHYHLRTIINTVILFIVILAIKIEPIKAFLASVTSMLILLLSEMLLVIIVTNITQQPLELLLQNNLLQIILPWPHIILLTVLAFYLSKKGIFIIKGG